jgi:hypothetical protein
MLSLSFNRRELESGIMISMISFEKPLRSKMLFVDYVKGQWIQIISRLKELKPKKKRQKKRCLDLQSSCLTFPSEKKTPKKRGIKTRGRSSV